MQQTNNQSFCKGILVRLNIECLFPQEPECKCSDDLSSVLLDDEGYWCGVMKEGIPVEKIPCENQEEWDEKYNSSFYEE